MYRISNLLSVTGISLESSRSMIRCSHKVFEQERVLQKNVATLGLGTLRNPPDVVLKKVVVALELCCC